MNQLKSSAIFGMVTPYIYHHFGLTSCSWLSVWLLVVNDWESLAAVTFWGVPNPKKKRKGPRVEISARKSNGEHGHILDVQETVHANTLCLRRMSK